MSLATNYPSILDQEYATKGDLHYGLRIPYYRIARAIRDGKIEMHLIDGMIKFKVKEVVEVLSKTRSRSDLFAR